METATFNTPFDAAEPRNGQTVTVHGDVWIGPNFLVSVTFPDGFTAEVWPEEIGRPEAQDFTDRYL